MLRSQSVRSRDIPQKGKIRQNDPSAKSRTRNDPGCVRKETDKERDMQEDDQEEEMAICIRGNRRDEESGDEDEEASSSSSEEEIPQADLPKDELGKYLCPFTLNRPSFTPVCECPARKTKIAVHASIKFSIDHR